MSKQGRDEIDVRLAKAVRTRQMCAPRPLDVVAIGVSTGGPAALAELVPALPADLPVPVMIVQHMPRVLTHMLAERLRQTSAIAVCEAEDGQALHPGTVYIAPGAVHMAVAGPRDDLRVRLVAGPPENFCRPAVDVMLRSLAEHAGPGVLAAILTGVGRDGLRGCQLVRAAGGQVIVQDEATSVVWDMPGSVATAGLAHEVLPLAQLAQSIASRVALNRIVSSNDFCQPGRTSKIGTR
jgi:two-component system chemotaxis response regulator CheB